MKIRRIASLAATLAVGALVLTACSDGGETPGPSDEPTSAETTAGGASTGIVSTNGSEPENPLIPTMTNETGGGKILDLIFAGLQYYDASGTPHLEVAESIETEDNVTWTVTLNEGWTFSDGTPVQALAVRFPAA